MEGLLTKTLQRVLSGLLVLTLSLSLIPTEVFAVQSEDTQPGLLETSWPALVEEGEVNRELTAEDVVGEDLSMRGENVKHFRLLDGTRLAVQYDDAVHYLDTDGKWADIDNSLQLQKINGQVLETEMAVGIDVLDTAMEKLQIGSYAESIQTEAQPAQADEEIVGEDLKHPDAQDSDDQTSPLPATQEDQTVASETQEPVAQEENQNGENQQTGNQQADLSAENPVESVLPVDQFVQIGAQTITTEEAEILSDVQLSAKENGTFDVSYAIGSGLGQEMAVRYKQYRAGFTLHDASLRPAEILESSISDPGSLIEAISPENLSSSIEYTDVQSGVDLVYTTLSGAVKEMIVVKSQQDSYTYVFDLALDNLKPEQNEDGSISLLDLRTDEEIYLIPAPYMYDANLAFSAAVSYTLTQVAGKYQLAITADDDWMNAEGRAFPVSIDPTIAITKQGALNNNEIQLSYTCSGDPTSSNPWNYMYLGYDSSGTGKNRILMKVNTLPELPDNSVVVNAAFLMAQYHVSGTGYSYIGDEMSSMAVEARAITANGAIANATWNTMPSYSDEVTDHTTVSSSTNGTYVMWDLTRLTKKWYAGTQGNYGVMFKAVRESEMSSNLAAKVCFYNVTNNPKFAVQYRNNVGLEDYYTYQAQNIGRAGTGYVSDYSSQLTLVKDDFTNTGAITFSLGHVYNSAYSSANFTDAAAHSVHYAKMLAGKGWKLSAQQSICPVSLTNIYDETTTYLVYTDADGTEHYFEQDGSYYYDEDGLNLKIQDLGSKHYKLIDEKDNYLEFYNGILSIKADANGNKIYFIYNNASAAITGTTWRPTGTNDQLLQIRQYNAGESNYTRLASLSYNTSGYLTSITDQAGRTTTYTYNSTSQLTTVTHDDGKTVNYTYSAGGKLASASDNEQRYRINYTYTDDRISSVAEYGNGTVGASFQVDGNAEGLTVYRDVGNDRVFNTDDDLLTYCVFDYVGRTINCYTTDSDGQLLGVDMAGYSENTGTSKTNNRLTASSSIGITGVNLLKNGGMESSGSWTASGTGTGATATINTTSPRTGSKAQAVTLSSSFSGTVQYTQTSVSLTAGTDYTFSAYVNTANVTEFTGTGIYLRAMRGAQVCTGDAYNVVTSESVAEGWHRVLLTFTPSTTGTYTLSICYNGFTGTVYADDAQLEVGDAPGAYNLLENAGFEENDKWIMSTGCDYFSNTSTAREGLRSLRMIGVAGSARSAEQTVTLNLSGDKTYVLGAWAKAVSVPTGSEGKYFRLYALLKYSDNTEEKYFLPFCADSTDADKLCNTQCRTKMLSHIRCADLGKL